jgi:DNA-binding transcriptional MerR regulator
MELTSIGEFARRSGLSPKALRLYDRLGLLRPARVDPDSGYRWYAPGQLDQARLIAGLRDLGLPLAEIGPILALDGPATAEQMQAMETWGEAHHRQPAGAIRQLLLWPRTSPGYGPECDFAVPLVPGEFR